MTEPAGPKSKIVAEVGGQPEESGVCVALYGDDLDPDDVTERLGCKPTSSHRRGDRKGPQSPPYPRGAWLLTLRGEIPTAPEQLIRRLLLRLPSDERVWRDLCSRFEIQVRIAVHFTGWNKGFSLPADVAAAVARMQASVVIDLYAYDDQDA